VNEPLFAPYHRSHGADSGIIGILLALAGLGYLINEPKPYFFPQVNLDFIMITFLGEDVFMFWLLIRGRKIPDQP